MFPRMCAHPPCRNIDVNAVSPAEVREGLRRAPTRRARRRSVAPPLAGPSSQNQTTKFAAMIATVITGTGASARCRAAAARRDAIPLESGPWLSSRTAVNEQVANEFGASQQYIAIAVWYDRRTLPQLAAHFYRQAVEERNHAMMLVQYLLDRDEALAIPGVEGPRTSSPGDRARRARPRPGEAGDRADLRARPLARADGDLSASSSWAGSSRSRSRRSPSMTTLLSVAHRAGDNLICSRTSSSREQMSATRAPIPQRRRRQA